MDLALLGTLAVLALIDSTSVGTLVLPVWLMLVPGPVRAGRVLLFLGSVAGCYLLLGVVLTLGAGELAGPIAAELDDSGARTLQLVAGAALVLLGLVVEPWTRAGKEKRRAARAARGPGRLARWRERASGDGPAGGVVVLAVAATGVEAVSMVPYLAAIGLLSAEDVGLPASVAVLAGYCLVMVLPALLLLAGRVAFADRIAPTLARLEAWLTRNSGEALAWVLVLLGLYLLGQALD